MIHTSTIWLITAQRKPENEANDCWFTLVANIKLRFLDESKEKKILIFLPKLKPYDALKDSSEKFIWPVWYQWVNNATSCYSVAVPLSETIFLCFGLIFQNPSGLIAVDSDHLCAGRWRLTPVWVEAVWGHSPPSQTWCHDALLVKASKRWGDPSFWICLSLIHNLSLTNWEPHPPRQPDQDSGPIQSWLEIFSLIFQNS